jgi:hypothetical protein
MHSDRARYPKDSLDTLGDRTTYVTAFVLGLVAVVISLELDDPAVFAIGWICVALPGAFISALVRYAWHQRRGAFKARVEPAEDPAKSHYASPSTRRT